MRKLTVMIADSMEPFVVGAMAGAGAIGITTFAVHASHNGCRQVQQVRAEAVRNGCAEWVVIDNETGETELRWKP